MHHPGLDSCQDRSIARNNIGTISEMSFSNSTVSVLNFLNFIVIYSYVKDFPSF